MENIIDELENFSALGLSEVTLEALRDKGFTEPTDIQRACIPLLLQKKIDVIGQAATGTGKTAAFGLPILEEIDEKDRSTQAIILAPTRELAIQVANEIDSLKGKRDISVDAIYGGTSYENQFRRLRKGLQIVVGTPGRIQDHLDRKTLDISHIRFAVLDEADEMLDMGFIDDIEKILENAPEDKRMLLFSATMPAPILRLAESFMHEYEIVRTKRQENTAPLTDQYYFELRESDKMEALSRVIDMDKDFYGVVFCKTKLQCEEIGRKLSDRGYRAEALHGDISQKQREIVLQKMRDHKISILVATDVAARGIDIQELTHVINYTIPQDPEAYIHRVGRTGRAGKKGTAITFITSGEYRKLSFIKKVSKFDILPGVVPQPEDIIKAKKERILEAVQEAVEKNTSDYEDIAAKLLEEHEADVVVKALLYSLYRGELDVKQYHQIRSEARKNKEDKKERKERSRGEKREASAFNDMTRLFIARGRNDGFTKRRLANTLIEECHVRDEDLQDIQVMENFSFINVPSGLVDGILRNYSDMGEDGKPLIVRAKPDKNPPKKSSFPERKRKSNSQTSSFKVKSRRNWEDEVQYYGRDTRDGDDIDYGRRDRGRFDKKKSHGKYNKGGKKRR